MEKIVHYLEKYSGNIFYCKTDVLNEKTIINYTTQLSETTCKLCIKKYLEKNTTINRNLTLTNLLNAL